VRCWGSLTAVRPPAPCWLREIVSLFSVTLSRFGLGTSSTATHALSTSKNRVPHWVGSFRGGIWIFDPLWGLNFEKHEKWGFFGYPFCSQHNAPKYALVNNDLLFVAWPTCWGCAFVCDEIPLLNGWGATNLWKLPIFGTNMKTHHWSASNDAVKDVPWWTKAVWLA